MEFTSLFTKHSGTAAGGNVVNETRLNGFTASHRYFQLYHFHGDERDNCSVVSH